MFTAAALVAPPALAEGDEPVSRDVTLTLGTETLTLKLPDLEGLAITPGEPGKQRQLFVKGKLGATSVSMGVWAYDRVKRRFSEPEDALDFVEDDFRSPSRKGDLNFQFGDWQYIQGAYGWAPYLVWAHAKAPATWKIEADSIAACGLLSEYAYSFEILARPRMDDALREALVEMFENGVSTDVMPRKRGWSDKEIQARWERDVPDEEVRKKGRKPIRTDHYVIMTNSSGGKLFAKKMEENYEKIAKVFPFTELETRRLMPVFLFRMPDEYYRYYAKIANKSIGAAARSKGHAWRDYYATYYESPNDPVHIHESTHQIFKNRLYLNGGGSWFQEGVAEYVERKYNDWNAVKSFAKRAAKDGTQIPFKEFFVVPSLINNPHAGATESYLQAASLIGFLRDGKFHPDKFDAFVRAIGRVPRRNLVLIEEKLKAIYGVDAEGLEQEWVKYWKKGGK